MSPWIRLAWKEFWLPFHYRKSGCPGGRDFVWLSTFMALMLTLMLLLLASREGMLNRFVDVLLGNVPGYGVPISVTNNMLSKGGINAIDTTVLREMRALNANVPGLQVHPHRNLEAVLHPLIGLPAEDAWENKQNGQKFGPDFDGWAVYPEDPLWQSTDSAPLPMEIVISRSLFLQYFNYGAYRNALRGELPDELFSTIPAQFVITETALNKLRADHLPADILETLAALQDDVYGTEDEFMQALTSQLGAEAAEQHALLILKHATTFLDRQQPFEQFWMRVKVGYSRELFSFQVRWVERFPVIDKISYVFPLTTYHALKAALDFPELRYYPEGGGNGGERFQQVMLEMPPDQDPAVFKQQVEAFSAGLQGELVDYRGDLMVSFPYPLRTLWIEAYAKQFGLTVSSLDTVTGDAITFEDGKIILPCGRLPGSRLQEANFGECSGDGRQPIGFDITGRGNGFRYALVYVPERQYLSQAVDQLKAVHDKALTIHSAYQDALNRFGFLSEMIAAMEKPFSWFLALFLVAFLGIQIATLIGHHRHRYGVLLAKGMEWWQIYAMLWFQILLAMALGMGFAFAAMSAAGIYLQRVIAPVAASYAATLSLADLNLLPFSAAEFLIASAIVLLGSWFLATVLLYFLPLRQRTHPATLL